MAELRAVVMGALTAVQGRCAVRLTVHGRIAGKGSRTVRPLPSGAVVTRPASKYEKPFVKAVADTAAWRRSEGGDLPQAPYRVELDFYFDPPKKATNPWPSRVDLDKAVRAVLDGLVAGGLLVDDRHVTELVARKHYAAAKGGECVQVTIT